jgi:hypothetical protein
VSTGERDFSGAGLVRAAELPNGNW